MKKILVLSLLAIIATTGCKIEKKQVVTLDEAKVLVQDFINNNLMQPGNQVSIKEVVEEDALYKVVVNMPNDQEIVSYLSKDGKQFFPQVMEINPKEDATGGNQPTTPSQPQAATNVPKQEKTKVELFVMSHCPFGTQMEKGIIPVIEKLGDKVDFDLKFCDYSMHGEKELNEELVQYCIKQEAPDKLLKYLRCFLGTKSGAEDEGQACLEEVGISKTKIKSCVAKTDKKYNVMADYKNKENYRGNYPGFGIFKEDNAKYGVGGSPTLVINGTTVRSGRDSKTLLTNICAGFENPPAECEEDIDATSPSSGFGWNTSSGGGSAASCGS